MMGKSIFDLPLRVTFYARVSTDKDEQLNSLENQVQYYTNFILDNPKWSYIPGYIDEGISGTSTKKRDSFNRMIRDAKLGLFDFIITKEISRFSRSTLDSIKYTQELLEHNVAVLFQNDNINTLDSDSEFRLVIMAGVAQDEVRKLSERLKFGFQQAIKAGHILGNDQLWGYTKKDGVLEIDEQQAKAVRMIFDLYANDRMGIRRISQQLTAKGFTSLQGNDFNVLTIRHILTNPKYKGWYCGNKSKSLDYRSKRKVLLEEEEWVMYPDARIPAIVSEELWNRANALYRARSNAVKQKGTQYHGRYAYSGKIICEDHGTAFHRMLLKSGTEQWVCKTYRQKGASACSMPPIRSKDLDYILAQIFQQIYPDQEKILTTLLKLIENAQKRVDYSSEITRAKKEISDIQAKKERLLELSISGVVSTEEFKKRNDGYNEMINVEEAQIRTLEEEHAKQQNNSAQVDAIRTALQRELSFQDPINSNLVSTLLERVVVKHGSTRGNVQLSIELKTGNSFTTSYATGSLSFCYIRS
jgi:DNA invertase Pin-like site-specific DNA recombinase